MRMNRHNPNPGLRVRNLRREGGYMLLILMFFVALIAFSMMATLPKLATQIKRDREEEMIHRGTEYARAIKKYYKKFNRYPNDLKDLESANNLRFIRRRYKDPESKDGAWRLLHITDVQQGVSNPNFGVSQAGNFDPTRGQNPGAPGTPPPPPDGGPGGSNLSLSPPGSPQPDQNPQPTGTGSVFSSGQGGANPGAPPGTPGAPGDPGANGLPGQPGQTFGGGGIVGVASMSKAKSLREFGGKSNYNKWMFIYDPTQDRGTLLKGPYNPQAFQGGGTNGVPGQPGQSGAPVNNSVGPNQGPAQQTGGPGGNMPPDQNAPPQ